LAAQEVLKRELRSAIASSYALKETFEIVHDPYQISSEGAVSQKFADIWKLRVKAARLVMKNLGFQTRRYGGRPPSSEQKLQLHGWKLDDKWVVLK
jgi:hypothetical protein